jgi:addiction module HigA family antidote
LSVAGGRGWIWIGAAHLGAGFFGCEHPFDAGSGCISLSLPGGDFRHQAPAIAKALDVSRQQVHRIMAETAPVTPEMALRLGKFCGNGPDLWLRMQASYDLWNARRRPGTGDRANPSRYEEGRSRQSGKCTYASVQDGANAGPHASAQADATRTIRQEARVTPPQQKPAYALGCRARKKFEKEN